MADISFNCPNCSQHFEAPPDMAGDKLPCPTCEKEITVPASEPAKPPAPQSMAPPSADKPPAPQSMAPPPADKPPAPQSMAPPPADKPPAPQSMAPPAKAPSLKVPGIAAKPAGEEEPEEAADGGGDKCPECQADLAEGAAICIKCGFNLKTGQKMGTDLGAAPAEEAAPDA